MVTIKRTDSNNPDFKKLVDALNKDLWSIEYADQKEYDKHNVIENLHTVVIAYDWDEAVGCGCFKKFDEDSAEIKRMFVAHNKRGLGISKQILSELETWAKEAGFQRTILETGRLQKEAIGLYKKSGYEVTENYGPYIGMTESVCMVKEL